jgi:hypothetical protein
VNGLVAPCPASTTAHLRESSSPYGTFPNIGPQWGYGFKEIAEALEHLSGAPQARLTLPLLACSDARSHGEGLRATSSRHDDLDRWVVADYP